MDTQLTYEEEQLERLTLAQNMSQDADFRAIIPGLTDEEYLRLAKGYWLVN